MKIVILVSSFGFDSEFWFLVSDFQQQSSPPYQNHIPQIATRPETIATMRLPFAQKQVSSMSDLSSCTKKAQQNLFVFPAKTRQFRLKAGSHFL
jgi:hypothetical protein